MFDNWGGRFSSCFGALAVCGMLAGCGGKSSGGGAATQPARGTPVCQEWQRALCDLVARCGKAADVAKCRDQAASIACKSDQAAADCAAELDGVACAPAAVESVATCDLREMADPAPAVEACKAYVDASCAYLVRCVGVTDAECRAELATQFDCSTVIGAKPSLDQCLSEIKAMSCGQGLQEFPATCNGAILQ